MNISAVVDGVRKETKTEKIIKASEDGRCGHSGIGCFAWSSRHGSSVERLCGRQKRG
ncbi:hypothetical protein [Atopobium deltae]|uniref:Uncharacterized protein n=1 Tax=Atopobium deltae TaxID=1393034 RepID=A0A133XXM6_9ACTN|nr:hypothetical protein [Atopobium deltae]KXB35664.1 hypothetical protein HMPREF3192_00069 [Atopobium deltae]